jgi:hypothetical protein
MPQYYFLKIQFNIILSARSRHRSCISPSVFPTKLTYALVTSPIHATCFSNIFPSGFIALVLNTVIILFYCYYVQLKAFLVEMTNNYTAEAHMNIDTNFPLPDMYGDCLLGYDAI